MVLTAWLLPGSFTVVNCSSLYFSKAGPSSETMLGESVKALISASAASVHELLQAIDWDTGRTGDDVCELRCG